MTERGCSRRAAFAKATLARAVAASMLLGAGPVWAEVNPNSPTFDIALIPDTQLYTTTPNGVPYMNDQFNWIVNNTTAKNIAITLGLGDIQQDGIPIGPANDTLTFAQIQAEGIGAENANIRSSSAQTGPGSTTLQNLTGNANFNPNTATVDTYNLEWTRATAAWNILDTAKLRYYATIGRHDYWHWGQHDGGPPYGTQYFTNYFGPTRYQNAANPNNTITPSPTGTGDMVAQGLNAATIFEAGGYKFLNISLQFDPQASDLAWAQSIINANPNIPTIITTADALDPTTSNDRPGTFLNKAGQNIWDNLITNNKQIVLLLAGHIDTTVDTTLTDQSNFPIAQVLTDYETNNFNIAQGFKQNNFIGGGFMRTLTFNVTNGSDVTITGTSFSPTLLAQGDPKATLTSSGTPTSEAFTIDVGSFIARGFGAPQVFGGAGKMLDWDPGHGNSASGGGAGTWDSGTASWFVSGTGDSAWSTAASVDTAMFAGTTGGAVTISGNVSAGQITIATPGYVVSGGTLTLTGAATIDTTSAGSATINSVIGGTSGMIVKGAKLVVRGTNTFAGTISVTDNATLDVVADSNLGATTNAITLDGGTFSYTGGAGPLTLTARTFTIGASGGTFSTPNSLSTGSNDKLIINRTNGITGSGDLTKSGPGWLTVYGNGNNSTGDWTLNGGVVEVGGPTNLGTGDVTVNAGGELANNTVAGPIANAITVNTGATIGADNNTTVTSTMSGAITANGNFNVRLGNFWSTLSQNVVLTGPISGPGALTVAPASGAAATVGKLTVTGDNSQFSGGVVIPTGTLSVGATAGRPLGTGPITLSGGKLAVTGQTIQAGAAIANAAITVSGFNKDTIYGSPDDAGTTTVGLDGVFGFFQQGFIPDQDEEDAGVTLSPGLNSGNIMSAITNSVTHTQTPFELASFSDLNTLQIAHASSGTLSLSSPGVYSSLAILATATFGADDTPNVKLNFADGTSVTTTYKAYDWSIGTDGARTAASAFGPTGVARYSPTQAPGLDNRAFGLYESDIDLTNINGVNYSNEQLVSLTFSAANGDGQTHAMTDVFAVSGSARAWVASTAGQSYANAVNVSANSSIDVSGVLAATMGALTINASKLSITSADATSNPYSLAFGNTTLNGAATFDVANSSGGGAGSLLLGVISGSGSITKSNSGTLKLKGAGSVISGGLTINAGTVEVDASTTVSTLSGNGTGTLNVVGTSLKLSGNSPAAASLAALSITSNGSLDLNANDLVIHYTTSPATTIRGYLVSGFNQGAWNGPGLDSLAAQIDSNEMTALGYAENSDLGLTTFDNGPVDAHTLIVKYTYYGDSNLDGKVDVSDFKLFLNGLVNGGSTWDQGDYTYDGQVDLGNDFNLFLVAYLKQGGTLGALQDVVAGDQELSVAQRSQLMALVPEPTSMGLLCIAGLMTLRRRRNT